MTNATHVPRLTLDPEAITSHLNVAQQRLTPTTVRTALADVPVMLAEIDRLSRLLGQARRDFADLLAAGCATLGADEDGEPDPLAYLRDAVAEHRAMPSDDAEDA